MKYYRLSKDGKDANIIIACETEEHESKAIERFGRQGYTLTECEAPKDAQIVSEEPTLGRAMPYMRSAYSDIDRLTGGFANEKTAVWDGPNCSRCRNRYNGTSDWCFNHHRDEKCYRFKLER